MEEKYINFYKMFDKRFKNNKKSYSLFELNQSRWNSIESNSYGYFKKMDKTKFLTLLFSFLLSSLVYPKHTFNWA